MSKIIRVLIVEDDHRDAELMVDEMVLSGIEPRWIRVENERDYLAALSNAWDVILADYSLPQFDALRALELLQGRGLDVPLIVVSGRIGEETAVEALKRGAADYLLKDRPARLGPAVRKAVEQARARQERRETEQTLGRLRANYRALFEYALEGIYQKTPSGHLLTANPATASILGCSSQEELFKLAVERGVPDYVDPSVRDALWSRLREEGAVFQAEAEVYRADGSVIWISEGIRAVRDDDGQIQYYQGFIIDITERKRQEARLIELSYQDELTGLPNRRLLMDRLALGMSQARRRGELIAVCLVDVDDFKRINDTYGHHAGDRLLIEVASRLQKVCRESDTVARYSGDEFVIILSTVKRSDDAVVVAERILRGMQDAFVVGGQNQSMTASIGISLFSSNDDDEIDVVLQKADVALYQAKELGKGRYALYREGAIEERKRTHDLGHDLQRAYHREEFLVYYQSQVSLMTDRIVGAEALIRWNHPERGTLLPSDFLPVAEETGMILRMDLWVLERACSQVKTWIDAGYRPLSLAVNLSARHFREPGFETRVADILRRTGLDPQVVELELTENVARINLGTIAERMQQVSDLGVRWSLDDFGTGYSSLHLLKYLPVSALKLDKGYVEGIARDVRDKSLVRAILLLARSLDLEVTAEGVETQEQRELLRMYACDRYQGYLMSPPMCETKFEELLVRQQAGTLQMP